MTDDERRKEHTAYMQRWRARHPKYHAQHPEWQRRWRAKNPEKLAEYNRRASIRLRARYHSDPERRAKQIANSAKWRRDNLTYYRDYQREWARLHRADKLGLTYEEFLALRPRMEGPCELCGDMGPMQMDHDHTTGKFRGLLCRPCNYVLGHARDRLDILRKGIEYLKAHGISET